MSRVARGDAVALARELVRIDSRNPALAPDAPGEADCARALGEIRSSWGMTVELDEVLPGHDLVLNFAAESHVDRSIAGAADFVMTNTVGVQTLLDYERAHANRANAITILENRLAALREGAQPSDGDPLEPAADDPEHARGGSKVSEATSGPPMNPPSHGDPSNPAQPR